MKIKSADAVFSELYNMQYKFNVNYDERGKEPISVEKFKEDLEFYTNSGIFADTIDFSYEKIAENKLHIAIGKASCYCYDDIDVTLQLISVHSLILQMKLRMD